MPSKFFGNFFKKIFSNLFKNKKEIKLGFYGPPNVGKTSLANRICKDWTGDEIGTVSRVPHETRKVQFKEKVDIKYKDKNLTFKLIDTQGIATKIDYEDFLKFKIKKKDVLMKFYENIGIDNNSKKEKLWKITAKVAVFESKSFLVKK